MAYDTYKCPDFPRCPNLPSHFTCVEVYTVKAGDTLYAVSQAYGVPVAVLMQVNRILNPYNLRIGQKICIPGKQNGSAPDDENGSGGNGGSNGPGSGNGNNDNNGSGGSGDNDGNGNGNSGNSGNGGSGGNSGDNDSNSNGDADPDCSGAIHIIAKGETLYLIAKMHKIPLGLLMRANPDIDPYNLRIGQKICIPAFPPERPGCPNRPWKPGRPDRPGSSEPSKPICCAGKPYVTQRGDTLARIMERFDITYGQLLAANPDVDFEESLENLTLCIPTFDDDDFEDCGEIQHTVKEGDTLGTISQMYGVGIDRLLMANPNLTTADFAKAGTVICIPD